MEMCKDALVDWNNMVNRPLETACLDQHLARLRRYTYRYYEKTLLGLQVMLNTDNIDLQPTSEHECWHKMMIVSIKCSSDFVD